MRTCGLALKCGMRAEALWWQRLEAWCKGVAVELWAGARALAGVMEVCGLARTQWRAQTELVTGRRRMSAVRKPSSLYPDLASPRCCSRALNCLT